MESQNNFPFWVIVKAVWLGICLAGLTGVAVYLICLRFLQVA